MKPVAFDYQRPRSVEAAVALLYFERYILNLSDVFMFLGILFEAL